MKKLKRDSSSKTRRRTLGCSPSAPTTRSKRRGAVFSNRTSPSGEIAVIESPKTYSTSSRAAS